MRMLEALQHTTPEIRKHWEATAYMPQSYNGYKVGQIVWCDSMLLLITRITDEVSEDRFYNGRVYYMYKGREYSSWLGSFKQDAIPLFFEV